VTTPVAGLQLPVVQGLPSSVDMGVPGWHTADASQSSLPLHSSKSLQLVPAATGVWLTPVTGSQASVVQELLSFVGGGVPATHAPALTGLGAVADRGVGAGRTVGLRRFEQTPVAGLHVPARWH
jgi:hypothetical protein